MPQPSPTPQEYLDAGFRILRCSGTDKRPVVGGFGADNPDFTCFAKDFQPGERVAILLGTFDYSTRNGAVLTLSGSDDLLICLDLDHGLRVADVDRALYATLPTTLTSKNFAHLYYRVQPSEARDQLKQWVNALKADDPLQGALDLKWLGGYAIEPGNVEGGWDGGFDPSRIAVLPDEAVQALVRLNTQHTGTRQIVDPDKVYSKEEYPTKEAFSGLADIWPTEDGHGFQASLALGGVLAGSDLCETAALAFVDDVLDCVNQSVRMRHVEQSFRNARDGADVNIMGWPTFLKHTNDNPAALQAFIEGVPGLSQKTSLVVDEVQTAQVQELFDSRPREPVEEKDLDRGDTVDIGDMVIQDHCQGAVYSEGVLWAKPHRDDPSAKWLEISEAQVHRWINAFAGRTCGFTKDGKAIPLKMSNTLMSGAHKYIMAALDQPKFFENPPARLVFRNGILDIASGKLSDATADDRVRSVLDFDYHEDQLQRHPPVHWAAFVGSVWDDDGESVTLLHQILGYLLSGRMDHQKMFCFYGESRSGKGVLLHILEAILGDDMGAFKISALDREFGMSAMMNKTVLSDADVRVSKSAFTDSGAIAERLLSITAGDLQAVRRMRKEPVNVVLPARLVIATNKNFYLRDEGGALAGRMVLLHFPVSYLGREDRELKNRLRTELPSIIALALTGLKDLDARGQFLVPTNTKAMQEELSTNQDDMLGWVNEYVTLADKGAVEVKAALLHLNEWRLQMGFKPTNAIRMGRSLSALGLKSRIFEVNGRSVRKYVGMKLEAL